MSQGDPSDPTAPKLATPGDPEYSYYENAVQECGQAIERLKAVKVRLSEEQFTSDIESLWGEAIRGAEELCKKLRLRVHLG